MNLEISEIVLGFHIVFAIIWVGGILFIGWGVFPAVKSIPVMDQQTFLQKLMRHTHWIFTLAGISVIATGILLGVVFGPIQSLEILWQSYYGKVWFSALIIAVFTLMWGIVIGYRKTMLVLSDDVLWLEAEEGKDKQLKHAMNRLVLIESVEVAGFVLLIFCMLLF